MPFANAHAVLKRRGLAAKVDASLRLRVSCRSPLVNFGQRLLFRIRHPQSHPQ